MLRRDFWQMHSRTPTTSISSCFLTAVCHYTILTVYNYLMDTNVSFIDCFEDPGPHGTGRYLDNMLPEIEKKDWRKGAQQPGMERCNCYSDEHYLPTLFHMIDPSGIANS